MNNLISKNRSIPLVITKNHFVLDSNSKTHTYIFSNILLDRILQT